MNRDDFETLCRLCRLSPTEEERSAFSRSLESILAYVEQLNEIDTLGVEPCLTVQSAATCRMDEDVPQPALPRERLMCNAPDAVGGMVRMPSILQPRE